MLNTPPRLVRVLARLRLIYIEEKKFYLRVMLLKMSRTLIRALT